MRKLLITVLLVVIVGVFAFLATTYFGTDHQDFLEFSARRDAWHTRCDAYVNVSLKANPPAQKCNTELQQLVTEAKARGWMK